MPSAGVAFVADLQFLSTPPMGSVRQTLTNNYSHRQEKFPNACGDLTSSNVV